MKTITVLNVLVGILLLFERTAARPSEGLLRKWNHAPDPNLGSKDVVRSWIAMGDSFSAGPGAGMTAPGDTGECRRRLGSYPPQLQRGPVFTGGYHSPPFTFASCTGDQVPQVLDNQVVNINQSTDIVTLSIGGNDIQFVPILQACVLLPFGNCDATIAMARDILYGNMFQSQWGDLMLQINDHSGWIDRSSQTRRTMLYITAYPPFFDSWTGQCNGIDFFPGVPSFNKLKLTNALRDQLNLLGQELNAALAYWVDHQNYVLVGAFAGANSADVASFVRFSNQDEQYNGHRFCRAGVTEPDRNNPTTWFFNLLSDRDTSAGVSATDDATVTSQNFASTFHVDPNTCNPSPTTIGQGEFLDDLPCGIAKAIADGQADNSTLWPALAEAIQKTFHPRIAGFAATADQVDFDLIYELPSANETGLHGENLRIMALGDNLGFLNGGDGDFFNVNRYRQKLYQLLTPPGANNQVQFVGTQRLGADPRYSKSELYLDADIPKLVSNIQQNQAIKNLQPNVVMMTAGAYDIRQFDPTDYNHLNQSRNNLEILIDNVFQQCSNCLILVGDVPPPGLWQWPPTDRQKQALQFNAMISEVVNKLQTRDDRKISKVHLPVANPLMGPFSNNWPSTDGYSYMAYEFLERLWQASVQKSWISPPVSVATPSSSPTPSCTPVTGCSNPSLEDGNGLCTCTASGATVTITPSGGPGNACPTQTCS